MDKIPFEDGTLVKAGYVEIDGTKHETVQPEYTGKTPLSAYNLKKMQDNIENSINEEKLVKRINISGASKQETREGYNLLNIEDYASTTGAIINSITSEVIDITSPTELSYESTLYFENIKLETGKTYTIQRIITTKSGTKSNSTGQIELYLGGTWKKVILGASSTKNTFTVDETSTYRIRLYVAPANTSDAFTITVSNFMIYEGTETKEYEQYGASPSIEYEAPIESVGDNINILRNTSSTQTINGVTFTVNKDGTIKVNGTATANVGLTLENDWTEYTKGTYRLTGCPSGGTASTYRLISWKEGYVVNAVDIGNGTNVTFDGTTKYRTQIFIESGVTVNNLVFRPKLKKGIKTTQYSPYGQGSVEIKQINGNLVDFNLSQNSKVTVNNDRTVTINGNGGFGLNFNQITFKTNKTYYMNWVLETGKVTQPNDDIIMIPGGSKWAKQGEFTSFSFSEETIKSSLWVNAEATFENAKIKIWISEEQIEYTPHQSQTKALYTQQPFRAIGDVKDRFVKKMGKWHEEHKNLRYIFTGNEGWKKSSRTDVNRYYVDNIINTILNASTVDILCSHFKALTPSQSDTAMTGISKYNEKGLMVNVDLTNTELDTVDKFKAKLTELYNAGTPVYVDYVLATPTLIPCTPEQVEVLNEIYSAYGEGMTNIICNDEIEPVIEIVKESKETVQSENDKAISALLARIEALEKALIS